MLQSKLKSYNKPFLEPWTIYSITSLTAGLLLCLLFYLITCSYEYDTDVDAVLLYWLPNCGYLLYQAYSNVHSLKVSTT